MTGHDLGRLLAWLQICRWSTPAVRLIRIAASVEALVSYPLSSQEVAEHFERIEAQAAAAASVYRAWLAEEAPGARQKPQEPLQGAQEPSATAEPGEEAQEPRADAGEPQARHESAGHRQQPAA